MQNQFERTEALIGTEAVETLKKSKVVIFGIGGVGSFVVEGLVRAGIQNIVLVDFDKINITNLNRQIHANHNTIGKYKVEVMKERILEINPNVNIETIKEKYYELDNSINYVVDCVDTFETKIKLVKEATEKNIPIISCMVTGNKLDPTKFEITDINKTDVCPLACKMRKELRKLGIKKLKVLYSKETPIKPIINEQTGEKIISSISFVPSVAGLIIAGEVIKDIIGYNK